jgi:hypothetical protein
MHTGFFTKAKDIIKKMAAVEAERKVGNDGVELNIEGGGDGDGDDDGPPPSDDE